MSILIPTTVLEFVEACKTLDNESIYELFEDLISGDLQAEIYSFGRPYNDTGIPNDELTFEPCRDAIYELGLKYNVQSMIEY